MAKETSKVKTEDSQQRFERSALAASKKYRRYKDVLAVVLDDDKAYTFEEVDAAIEGFNSHVVVEAKN